MELHQHITGCILGTAVGDAIGLPREGLSRRRAQRLFGDRPLSHALVGRRGMCSDDTEHTVMVVQALMRSGGDPDRFARDLARRMRWWLLRVPAGVGFGTLRACMKLWIGFGPARSGVASAGNGPAMRSAVLGVLATSDDHLADLVRASTQITHTDPRAEQGAMIVASAARLAVTDPQGSRNADTVADVLLPIALDGELRKNMEAAFQALRDGLTPGQFAHRLGLDSGITGYVNQTVPVAIYCWLANRGSFRDAVESAVCLGGDSDTVGAIVGALAGVELGPEGIPAEWLEGLREWPATVEWMTTLGRSLAASRGSARPVNPPELSALLVLARNVLFAAIVLAHGLRRLLPPY